MQMTKKSRVLLIAFLGIMSAMAPLATDMYLPALPALSSEFSASTSATQLTLTMTMLGMAIGQIFLGPLSDMYGRKASLFVPLIGFFSMSLGGIMMPLVGIAGDHTAMPMAILMVTGYGLGVALFYTHVAKG